MSFKVLLIDRESRLVHETMMEADDDLALSAQILVWQGRSFVFDYKISGDAAYQFVEANIHDFDAPAAGGFAGGVEAAYRRGWSDCRTADALNGGNVEMGWSDYRTALATAPAAQGSNWPHDGSTIAEALSAAKEK